ncbi:tRNA threonylcarbamoyl adenosine modification protein YjeE [Actinobacteria bacterium IMCC26256]|nr:tRNA threonylcarbamoyl adenosine modification protein YjeE [Actinobacteria bacterium IMCC26256]
MTPVSLITHSVETTRALGGALAEILREGDLIILSGDLGAGKTALAQGIGAGLGVTEPMLSPTFTVVREYIGRLPLQHLDVYRLGHMQEVLDLGIDEVLDNGVTIVEWGDAALDALGDERLEITISLLPEGADSDRLLVFQIFGEAWSSRSDDLQMLVGALQ